MGSPRSRFEATVTATRLKKLIHFRSGFSLHIRQNIGPPMHYCGVAAVYGCHFDVRLKTVKVRPGQISADKSGW